MSRDYKKEYKNYHSKPEQIKNRAKRNKARREMGLKGGDPREVDHIKPLSKGGSNKKRESAYCFQSYQSEKRQQI